MSKSASKAKLMGSTCFYSFMAYGPVYFGVHEYWLIDFPVYDIKYVDLIFCGWLTSDFTSSSTVLQL